MVEEITNIKHVIKILVMELGEEEFARQVEEEYQKIDSPEVILPGEELERIAEYFKPPQYETLEESPAEFEQKRNEDKAFAAWVETNVAAHKVDGYAIVNISLKPTGGIPGDATAEQMYKVADLSESYSFKKSV